LSKDIHYKFSPISYQVCSLSKSAESSIGVRHDPIPLALYLQEL